MTRDTGIRGYIEANVDAIARSVARSSGDPAVDDLDEAAIRPIVADVVERVVRHVDPGWNPRDDDQDLARREWNQDVGLSPERILDRHGDDLAVRNLDRAAVAAVVDATLDEIDARVGLAWVEGEEAGWILTTVDVEEAAAMEEDSGWLLSTDDEDA